MRNLTNEIDRFLLISSDDGTQMTKKAIDRYTIYWHRVTAVSTDLEFTAGYRTPLLFPFMTTLPVGLPPSDFFLPALFITVRPWWLVQM